MDGVRSLVRGAEQPGKSPAPGAFREDGSLNSGNSGVIVGSLSLLSREHELPVGKSNHCRKATNVDYLCVILLLALFLAHCALAPSVLAFAPRTRGVAHLRTPTPWYNHRQIVLSLLEKNPSPLLSESKDRRSQLFSNGKKSACEARSLIVSIINSVSSFSSF